MKLIFAVVNNDDLNSLMDILINSGYAATRLSSTGGFLKAKNVTLMLGVEDDKVDEVLKIIEEKSSQRKVTIAASISTTGDTYASMPIDVTVGGATVFVTDVERFEKY